MKLLLDTHAALWYLAGDDRLGANAHRQLIDDANRVLISAAVVWEISIKRGLRKLEVPDGYLQLMIDGGAQPLPITVAHAAAAGELPPHHRDPFDRMLVSQASIEGAAIVTRDDALRPYDVPLIW